MKNATHPADQQELARGHHEAELEAASARLAHLEHVVEHAAHLLPAQGPITVFVHHNTLHAFDHLPFDEAVLKGGQLFNCQPYLSEQQFQAHVDRGRIRDVDLKAALREDLAEDADLAIPPHGTRTQLRFAMLRYPLQQATTAELRWFVAETDALRRFRPDVPGSVRERLIQETRHWAMRDLRRDWSASSGAAAAGEGFTDRKRRESFEQLLHGAGDARLDRWQTSQWEAFTLQALWRICRDGVHGIKPSLPPRQTPVRHRDLLLEATGEDSDALVHDLLTRFCGAFLDQGFAHWAIPERDRGFLRTFCSIYSRPAGPPNAWMRGLAAELRRVMDRGLSPRESILESLRILGVAEAEWEAYVTATLLALRGWAGMILQMETRQDRVAHPIPKGSLVEYLAVRLILERFALAYVARRRLKFSGDLAELRRTLRHATPKAERVSVDQRSFLLFQLAQLMGWLPTDLLKLSKADWARLVGEVESFSGIQRRRIYHLAFERRYRNQTLDALAVHATGRFERPVAPRFQMMCCIDDREESFRRHVEEIAPDCETFGVAGFFAVAMYYRGCGEAFSVPLCPVVIRPEHWVEEQVVYTFEETRRRRERARRALGSAYHQVHLGSRTFAGGAVLAGLGVLASVPLVARTLFPRLTARIRETAGRLVDLPDQTRLTLERSEETPGPQEGHVGFTVSEMADIVQRILRDVGLVDGFARLVLIVGHGSNSVNNPHKSAYDCGACGGGAGGPNARAWSEMANDPRVRELLAARGLEIPSDTYFVGGYHNTCDDSVIYYDLDRLPKSHYDDFEAARRDVEQACDRNAHERCRRFISAPLDLSFKAARRHVQQRAEDLAQVRPECGHATNALCYVGRRARTRGLFMDRRVFLTSYDPLQDDAEQSILTRILSAVVPVCAGINLEYYFSYVDPTGWGCGTKLPHNVASMLGIMDGPLSDLRPGLPWQMVEIHEPVRLLFIIETQPEQMLRIMDRNETIGRHCRNSWVQTATLDPVSNQIYLFQGGSFQPYFPEATELERADSSVDWYRGWRDHLGFAAIGANLNQLRAAGAASRGEFPS